MAHLDSDNSKGPNWPVLIIYAIIMLATIVITAAFCGLLPGV